MQSFECDVIFYQEEKDKFENLRLRIKCQFFSDSYSKYKNQFNHFSCVRVFTCVSYTVFSGGVSISNTFTHMSTLLGKEHPNHSSSFIEHVTSGNNSNASSISSVADDFDDDHHSSAINVTTPPAFKAVNSIAAAAATATAATSSILTNLSRLNAAHHHHHHHLSTSTNSHQYRGSSTSSSSKDMGGFSIPHHSLSAAFYGYHTSQMSNECLTNIPSSSSSSSSGGAAVAFSSAQHGHHHHHHHYSSSTTSSNGTANQHGNAAISGSSSSSHTSQSNSSNKPSPFLLPAQLYKSLFANAVLHNPDKIGCSPHPFPRNLLFSYSDRSPNSPDNFDNDEKPTISTEVRNLERTFLLLLNLSWFEKSLTNVMTKIF